MVWTPSQGAPFPTASAAGMPGDPSQMISPEQAAAFFAANTGPNATAATGYRPGGSTGLGGSLPWQNQQSPFPDLSGSPTDVLSRLGPAYKNAYDSSLKFNEALYNRADQGYRDIAAFNTSAGEALSRGYTDLSAAVLGKIAQTGQARATAIDDAYERANAESQQSLINRGLGNTTVLDSQRRSAVSDRERARTQLSNDLAEMTASYQSNLGLSGLRSQENQIDRELGTGYRHMDFLNSVTAGYPDAGMYASIAQQVGAADQADKDRAFLRDQMNAQLAMAGRAGQGGGGGGGFGGETPLFGGGIARGSGGLPPPMANYGGGGGGGLQAPSGFSFGPTPVGYLGGVAPPAITGVVGGGPGTMEYAGSYTGYGGFDLDGFGGDVSGGGLVSVGGNDVSDFLAGGGGVAAGGGGYTPSSGFGGGFGSYGTTSYQNDYGDYAGYEDSWYPEEGF